MRSLKLSYLTGEQMLGEESAHLQGRVEDEGHSCL